MLLRRGQSLVDLAIILSVVGLVFVTMNTYIKRGLQARVKDLTDYVISPKQAEADGAAAQNSLTLENSNMEKDLFVGGKSSLNGYDDTTYSYNIPWH
jgi:Na+(H+)/acetate symporter ActP